MSRGYLPISFLGLIFVSSLSVSCGTTKSDDVAVEAASPPPSAYPTTPEGYADTSAPVSSAATSSGPSVPPAPEPPAFKLREGETLVSYRIELGDNLSSIAKKYNTSVSRIQAANGMTNTKIFAGKSLQVPTAAPPGLALNSPKPTTPVGAYKPSGTSYGAAPTAPASSVGSYPSTTAPVAPPTVPGYPATTSSAPASTSYPPVSAPPIPPQTQQAAGAFPTPNFSGGGGIQFSE